MYIGRARPFPRGDDYKVAKKKFKKLEKNSSEEPVGKFIRTWYKTALSDKTLLLQNYSVNFNKTRHKASLVEEDSRLFK